MAGSAARKLTAEESNAILDRLSSVNSSAAANAKQYTHNAGDEKLRAAAELENLMHASVFSHSADDNGAHTFASGGSDCFVKNFFRSGEIFFALNDA